ncbi:MAG: hypothetical protein GY792_27970 [Gammaproteobacteria bacterium]|nr:hypothetical protein [Gammaproteobacteria bacterium]
MTPSPLINFLDASLPVDELVELFRQYQHPRIPVFQGHWDNVIGFFALRRYAEADPGKKGSC